MKNFHPNTFHSQLMNTWSKQRPDYRFVNDGILNMSAWEATSPKVMFLLKETTNDFTEIAGQTIDVRDGSSSHFWWNICYWKYAIKSHTSGNYPEFIPINQLPEVESNNYILDEIAYVNIKKNCENKNQSTEEDILGYALKDQAFLKEQIDLISPDFIICNATTYKAYQLLYDADFGAANKVNHHDRTLLNFRHPSYFQIKGGRETNFKDFVELLIN